MSLGPYDYRKFKIDDETEVVNARDYFRFAIVASRILTHRRIEKIANDLENKLIYDNHFVSEGSPRDGSRWGGSIIDRYAFTFGVCETLGIKPSTHGTYAERGYKYNILPIGDNFLYFDENGEIYIRLLNHKLNNHDIYVKAVQDHVASGEPLRELTIPPGTLTSWNAVCEKREEILSRRPNKHEKPGEEEIEELKKLASFNYLYWVTKGCGGNSPSREFSDATCRYFFDACVAGEVPESFACTINYSVCYTFQELIEFKDIYQSMGITDAVETRLPGIVPSSRRRMSVKEEAPLSAREKVTTILCHASGAYIEEWLAKYEISCNTFKTGVGRLEYANNPKDWAGKVANHWDWIVATVIDTAKERISRNFMSDLGRAFEIISAAHYMATYRNGLLPLVWRVDWNKQSEQYGEDYRGPLMDQTKTLEIVAYASRQFLLPPEPESEE